MLKTGHRTKYHLRAFEFLAARRRSRAVLTCTLLASFLSTMPTGGLQAGDILRGGASAGNAKRNSEARANAGAAAAEAAKVRAQDRLARTTKAVNDMRALQASARAAGANTAFNGLYDLATNPNGGLRLLARDGADAPTASGNNVNIKQTASQALLNWQTFDVGSQTTVNFDQSAGGADSGKWIAFNKVSDPTGKPSEIRGKINAQGQVYIINQNGIIFGAGSQVNARALVASALPINDNLVANGLLNNKDAQFLFSKNFATNPATTFGDVVVERGAKLSSPEGEGGNGGRIMLVGANVQNAGEISTPSGQSILAAGLQIGVAAHAETDPSLRGLDVWVGDTGSYAGTVTNTGLVESQRGSIVAVGKRIAQSGVMESSTSVNLNGRIDLLASFGAVGFPEYDSSSQLPFLNQSTGIVEFSPNSTTRILPDFSSNKKIPGSKLSQSSQVNIEGLGIHFAGGSSLIATSGIIGIRAGTWPFIDTNNDGIAKLDETKDQFSAKWHQRFLLSAGQINIGSGALIDASGTMDAFVPLAQNFLAIQLRGSELADSPLQRSGGLRGKPLLVDLRRTGTYGGRGWIGTPLGDLTGFANITERDIAQLTTRGGSISISAGDSVVTASGATIDVSGGYFRHEGGLVKTTRLLRQANLIDMHNAVPDVSYDGVYNGVSNFQSSKWGTTETFIHALAPLGGGNERQHVEGASAGTLAITAPKMGLAAELLGQSITGPRQQASPAGQGTLQIKFQGEIKLNTGGGVFLNQSPNAPNLVFSNTSASPSGFAFELVNGAPVAMPFAAGSTFTVSSDWWEEDGGGFGNISIDNSEGDITVPAGSPLQLPPGGSLTLVGRNVSLNSDITIPGGSLSAISYNYTPLAYARDDALGLFKAQAPAPITGQGTIRVAPGVILDMAGQFIDERLTAERAYPEKYILKGGSVSLTGYSVILGANSLIDASGGVRARPNGKFQYGNGGSISLLAGKDPALSTTTGGQLRLEGKLQSYSAAKGGSLTIQANGIQIGGTAASGVLLIQPDFFRNGGFTSYSLTGIGSRATDGSLVPGVRVAAGTAIEPVAESWRHMPFTQGKKLQTALARLEEHESRNTEAILAALPSTSDTRPLGMRRLGMDALFPVLLPEGLRQPASLALSAIGYDDGFTLAQTEAIGILDFQGGAKILTDAGATVRMSGEFVRIAGEISAPGGTIDITGSSSFKPLDPSPTKTANFALPTVHITSNAKLSVAGKTIPLDDPYGWDAGIIHPGGTIKISGNIIAESGSVLDASGTTTVLDFHPSRLNPSLVAEVPQNAGLNTTPWQRRAIAARVDSDGGRIDLSGSQFLYVDSSLSARAGGESAVGGTLSVSSGRFYPSGDSRTGGDTNLYVGASGLASRIADTAALATISNLLLTSSTPDADLATALGIRPAGSQGVGFFAMDRFTTGGFDFLDLGFKYFASPANNENVPYGGNLEFMESTAISARGAVRLAGGGVIRSAFPISISAPYVAIGQDFRAPLNTADLFQPFRKFVTGTGPGTGTLDYNLAPTGGAGSLSVSASLIDLGTLVTQGLSSASFSAPSGDIRGNGILSVTGSISFAASQIYPTTAAKFDMFAYDNGPTKGSISVISDTTPALPLSAGGRMRLFADSINIAGNLRAPLGSIVLGWDGTASSKPDNTVVGTTAVLTKTTTLNLSAGASVSVSGVDPTTGKGILVPYGVSPDGLTWIDPRGEDITVTGLPNRGVSLAAESVSMDSAASIDLRGGGDLLAYRWIPGVGGSSDLLGTATLSWSSAAEYNAGDLVLHGGKTWSARRDLDPSDFTTPPEPSESTYWSLVPESYAILPNTSFAYAPFNSFNTGDNSGSLGGDPGFVSSNLRVSEQIQLPSSSGLPAGSYTLLPKRYGILPGAYLVVPQSGSLASTGSVRTTRSPGALKASAANNRGIEMEEGSRFVYGYAQNGLSTSAAAPSVYARFEVVPPSVIQNRVQFDKYQANSFLSGAASRLGLTETQLLPMDSAPLQVQGNTGLSLLGSVLAPSSIGGRGADIDLSSNSPIQIHAAGAPATSVALDASVLNSWKANSLLIGALRTTSTEGITLDVRTNNLSLNAPQLTAAEIILASKGELVLADGSSITSTGSGGSSKDILIAGDGTLVRVSSAKPAVSRTATTGAPSALLQIGQNTALTGSSVVLDSSRSSVIAPSLNIETQNLALGAGQISLVFDFDALPSDLEGSEFATHLVLQDQFLLDALSAQSLTLQSYTTIDLYSNASVNGAAGSIELLASGLRGYTTTGSRINLTAKDILVSNPNSATTLAAPGTSEGTLAISAETLSFGENAFSVSGFQNLNLSASSGASIAASGSFAANGDFLLTTPSLTAAKATSYSLSSTGTLELAKSAGAYTTSAGLGATLSLAGSSVNLGSDILLPSGSLEVTASTGSILVTGTLSTAGKANTFFDLTRYTDGGDIELNAKTGSVNLAAGSLVSVAAPAGGGSAGSLTIKSPGGEFLNAGAIDGKGGTDGRNGSFVLDAQAVADFDALTYSLEQAGFTRSMDFRLRTGDVTIGRDTTAHTFLLSTDGRSNPDDGSIMVNNRINASGETGGRIELIARNNLTLSPTGSLTVAAQRFSNAGKGGHIHLEAGAAVNGSPNTGARLDLQKDPINNRSSSIDLSVKPFSLVDPIDIRGEYVAGDYLTAGSSAFYGKFQGTLHLRAPQLSDGSSLQVNPIDSTILGGSSIQIEGYRIYDLTDSGGIITSALKDKIKADGDTFIGQDGIPSSTYTSMHDTILQNNMGVSPITVFSPGAEIINRAAIASLDFSLNALDSKVTVIPESGNGGGVTFTNGTPGNNLIRTNIPATITSANGVKTTLAADVSTSLAPGSTISFNTEGTITFFSGTGGTIPVTLSPGATYIQSLSGASGTISAPGSVISLRSAGPTGSSIALTAGSVINLPNGTNNINTTNRIRSTVPGIITSPTGAVTNLVANTNTQIAPGSTISLNSAGTIRFQAGTGGPILVALKSGSMTTSGLSGLTPSSGDIVLGTTNQKGSNSDGSLLSNDQLSNGDWNLSSFRFGAKSAPGVLTLRAKGDLVFNNTLSDGFESVDATANNGWSSMWLAAPLKIKSQLPTNLQSWSFKLTAGADFSSVDPESVISGTGKVLVGEAHSTFSSQAISNDEKPETQNPNKISGDYGRTLNHIKINPTSNRGNRYEVIRTGTGDIQISAGSDVQLRNSFSSIYTSGVALPNASRIFEDGDFSIPVTSRTGLGITPPATTSWDDPLLGTPQQNYTASFTISGGNLKIYSFRDIGKYPSSVEAIDPYFDSNNQLPSNWLYRRGELSTTTLDSEGNPVFAGGTLFQSNTGLGKVNDASASTSWWVDYSNFFGAVGAMGGGSVQIAAERDIVNLNASVPTTARMAGVSSGSPITASINKLWETGGGDLELIAGRNILSGSYYVERGNALLAAGKEIKPITPSSEQEWIPATLFGGDTRFSLIARSDIEVGPASNAFLLPQGLNNRLWYRTHFHTINPSSSIDVRSYGGGITHRLTYAKDANQSDPFLWHFMSKNQGAQEYQPWTRFLETDLTLFKDSMSVSLPILRSYSFGGDIAVVGKLNLFPSAKGELELLANNSLNGLNPSGWSNGQVSWITASLNLSDANPTQFSTTITPASGRTKELGTSYFDIKSQLVETGSFIGDKASIDVKSALHNPSPLHSNNPNPVLLYASGGDISGLTLYSAKKFQTVAQRDITDIAFYLQHTGEKDVSIVSAARDVIPFNENYLRRGVAGDSRLGNMIVDSLVDTVVKKAATEYIRVQALPGDIQIGGRGVLEVLAGRNVDLGTGPNLRDGRGKGITSIGRSRNPFLPFEGAELLVLAGVGGASGGPAIGLTKSILNFSALKGGTPATEFAAVTALKGLFVDLARIGESALESGDYSEGYALVNKLFGSATSTGDIFTRARDIRTANGGSITIATPGGGVTMASDIFGNPLTPPGIVTEYGGAISILTDGDVNIGQARIFTLRGGDLTIWSSSGDIAAGNAPKTVVTAPPTRVLIDATSADIQTDLGGLATGGGIGVLAAVEGVEEGAVNLIAPGGTVDAGDAGIRATGDIKIAAAAVVNADNISAGGTSAGVPSSPTVAAPNIGGLTSGSSSTAAASSAASQVSQQSKPEEKPADETPSLITVEVLGYGGGDSSSAKEDEETSAEG